MGKYKNRHFLCIENHVKLYAKTIDADDYDDSLEDIIGCEILVKFQLWTIFDEVAGKSTLTEMQKNVTSPH